MTEFFGRDWVLVLPESAAVLPRFGFGGGVGGVLVVALVVMRQPGAEHFKIDVAAINIDRAEDASVLVAALVLDADVFAEDKRRKMLLRLLPERLGLLGSVNSVKADFVLRVRRVEDRDRVAVRDLYDSPADLRKRRVRLRARPRVEGCYAALPRV